MRNLLRIMSMAVSALLIAACGGSGSSAGSGSSSSSSASSSSTSSASSSSSSAAAVRLTNVFTSLPAFVEPLGMLQAPGDNARWFVIQRGGIVRQFSNVANVAVASDFIDIDARVDSTSGEMGLLGMAFHPNFPTDPRVFLSYTATVSGPIVSRISAFTTSNAGQTLNPNSEQILLTLNQPATNHNGGHIAFGNDGYLYIGFGDGGGSGDPAGNAQNLNTLLGKLLRIDVGNNGATTYGIPPGNLYAANAKCTATGGSAPCPELYAWGFRNPWRWSFDKQNGDLWLGDVGQNAWEEIDQVQMGGNYGWRCREGAHDFNTSGCGTGYIDPVAEYGRSLGSSVTGGYVYRGTQNTSLFGRYLFADFGSGNIFAWLPPATTPRAPTLLLDTSYSIASFGEANNGDCIVYAGDHGYL